LRKELLQFGLSKERPLFFNRRWTGISFLRERPMVGEACRKEKEDHPHCQDLVHYKVSPESPRK
jgi:hypothetical protein